MGQFLIFCGLLLLGVSADVPSYAESILTRSTAAQGTLNCGKVPAVGVYVRLYRNISEVDEDLLAATKTNEDGFFTLEGNTAGRPVALTGIEPTLRIYHKCDIDSKKEEYRKFAIHYGHSFVTLGRVPRKPYNLGVLNLQIIYPNEEVDKKFKELKPTLYTKN